nr:uncharacterized protein CFP56_00440 [Quercus suber]
MQQQTQLGRASSSKHKIRTSRRGPSKRVVVRCQRGGGKVNDARSSASESCASLDKHGSPRPKPAQSQKGRQHSFPISISSPLATSKSSSSKLKCTFINHLENSFPYDGPGEYYQLFLPNDQRPHGYMLPAVVEQMPWTETFIVDSRNRTVTVRRPASISGDPSQHESDAFAAVINAAIDRDIFPILHGEHSEMFSIIGARHPVRLERFASSLFGITGRGAHLTMYTRTSTGSLKIWVPRRSPTMFTYPNKLDTSVAGGVPAHQTPWENLVQEADEEASLPARLITSSAKAGGVLTYLHRGRAGLVSGDCVYVYDLEVDADVVPVPKDGEVKEFYLMDVDEIKVAMAKGEFKTNSAVVMLDFFVRHGILTAANEKDYVEIVSRMHRRLPFPTSGG